LNWVFHLDDLSDDMDDRGTAAVRSEIMTTYHHPDTYDPKTHLGKLAKRFGSLAYE
jgi:streptomycin 6-kinase